MFFNKKNSFFLIFLFLCLFSVDGIYSYAQDAPAVPTAEEKSGEQKSEPKSGLIIEKGESKPSVPASDAAEPIELPKSGSFVVTCTVLGISQPVNPHETIMLIQNSEGKEAETILSPATHYDPRDYYPREGDLIKASCAVVGAFNKKVFAYSISLITENPASKKKSK